MKEHGFLKGMGLGILAGTALGMTMNTRHKGCMHDVKRSAQRTVKKVGQVMEDLGDQMGL